MSYEIIAAVLNTFKKSGNNQRRPVNYLLFKSNK